MTSEDVCVGKAQTAACVTLVGVVLVYKAVLPILQLALRCIVLLDQGAYL